MKTETLIELQRSITQGEWMKASNSNPGYFPIVNSTGKWALAICSWPAGVNREQVESNQQAIALVPELIAEVIRLREALSESVALNENFVSVVEPETLLHLSEYRAVIKQARAALANGK